ncbi:hypothetical protein D3C73_837830 [compost metagenome]
MQNPVNPNNPVGPADPSDPSGPSDPAGPTDPNGPSDPTDSTGTAVPTSTPGSPVIPVSKPESQSSLSFEMAKGERQVLFPVTTAANDGKNALKIKNTDVEIEVPAEVLKELQAQVTGSELEHAKIKINK